MLTCIGFKTCLSMRQESALNTMLSHASPMKNRLQNIYITYWMQVTKYNENAIGKQGLDAFVVLSTQSNVNKCNNVLQNISLNIFRCSLLLEVMPLPCGQVYPVRGKYSQLNKKIHLYKKIRVMTGIG